jgi:hypothetical protein
MRNDLSNVAHNTQGFNEPLSEPHFDDESTLLSARRVVPFHKLSEKTNSKRYLFFGATVAAALVMGVVGGVIYSRLEGMAARTTETTQQVAQPAPTQPALPDEFVSSSVQNNESASAPAESRALAEDSRNQKIIDPSRIPSTSARKRVSPNPVPARQVQAGTDEWEYYANEREIRRAERREARRARRQAAREIQRSDDLFRIREIFEGSSRP